jgi:hypothetical protein
MGSEHGEVGAPLGEARSVRRRWPLIAPQKMTQRAEGFHSGQAHCLQMVLAIWGSRYEAEPLAPSDLPVVRHFARPSPGQRPRPKLPTLATRVARTGPKGRTTPWHSER